MIGRALGLAYTIGAWWFLASVLIAGVIGLVRKAKARGKRKFRDEPLARVYALHQDTTHAHEMDAL